jgi:hypothetical protein
VNLPKSRRPTVSNRDTSGTNPRAEPHRARRPTGGVLFNFVYQFIRDRIYVG